MVTRKREQRTTVETWFTLEEAAAISRRSVNAMRQLRVKGRGPHFRKVDGRLLVSGTDLHTWLAGDDNADQAATG